MNCKFGMSCANKRLMFYLLDVNQSENNAECRKFAELFCFIQCNESTGTFAELINIQWFYFIVATLSETLEI